MTAPGSNFELRPATSADVQVLRALIHGLAEYEKLTHLFLATAEDIHAALFGARPAAEALIAWVRRPGSPVAAGFALYFHNYSTFLGRRGLYLEDIFVRPEHRGQGCGKALLAALAHIAKERGCGRFEWSVLDWNVSAQQFYESLGATVLPDWRIVRMTGPALERLAAQSPVVVAE